MIELKQGDCLELMKEIPDQSIDLILCDLPYGITAKTWDKAINFEKLWEQYLRIGTKICTVLLFANGSFLPRVLSSKPEYFSYMLTWVKNNRTGFIHAKNRPLVQFENIVVFSKGSMGHKSLLGDKRMTYNPQGLIKIDAQYKVRDNMRIIAKRKSHYKKGFIYTKEYTNYPSDVLFFNSDHKKIHTSQKPVPLLEYLIKTYTNEGDTVLDNCMGSGSTGVACINTNRNFIGYELDSNYFKIAKNRIEQTENNYLLNL